MSESKKTTFTTTFSPEQSALLSELMAESHQTNRTAFLVMLLSQEKERRDKSQRRPVGRPKGNDDDDEPRDIPNPNPMDAKTRPFLTKSEHEAIQALRGI